MLKKNADIHTASHICFCLSFLYFPCHFLLWPALPPKGENANFTYRLDDPSGAFGLDLVSGWLTVADQTKLDRESQRQLRLDIYADELVRMCWTNGENEGFLGNVMVVLVVYRCNRLERREDCSRWAVSIEHLSIQMSSIRGRHVNVIQNSPAMNELKQHNAFSFTVFLLDGRYKLI